MLYFIIAEDERRRKTVKIYFCIMINNRNRRVWMQGFIRERKGWVRGTVRNTAEEATRPAYCHDQVCLKSTTICFTKGSHSCA